jgi:uncharacterized membrane protein
MKPIARETIAERIEQLDVLDTVSEPLQNAVRSAVPQESELKDLLSGTWLGHPLHPPLTDAVIGAWTSALLLDLAGGERTEEAADRLVAAGILAALPTAAAGLSDWAELHGGSRRVGSVHAIGYTTALVLHALSWAARRRSDRGRGVALSALGYAIARFSAWLGGHLSFGKGVGVNQAALRGRAGYESQQTDEPAEPDRRDNLFEARPADWGAHGRFDGKAHPRSVQFWIVKHRRRTAALALAALAVLRGR